MRPFGTLLLGWLITGGGALLGSIAGNAAGSTGLLVGAVAGGLAGVATAAGVARRLGWIAPGLVHGALVGGCIGFALAVPLALLNMESPVVPVASGALAGVGLLIGAGFARGASGQ